MRFLAILSLHVVLCRDGRIEHEILKPKLRTRFWGMKNYLQIQIIQLKREKNIASYFKECIIKSMIGIGANTFGQCKGWGITCLLVYIWSHLSRDGSFGASSWKTCVDRKILPSFFPEGVEILKGLCTPRKTMQFSYNERNKVKFFVVIILWVNVLIADLHITFKFIWFFIRQSFELLLQWFNFVNTK